MHVHEGTFTVCSNVLQNKVTQQNTDCGYVSDGSSNRIIFSDSACVSDGLLHKRRSEPEVAQLGSPKRLCTNSPG